MLSDIETTTEENTDVHYYEIEDTPSHFSYDGSTVPKSLNTIEAIDHFENISQVQYKNIALTSTTELTNMIQINTKGHEDNTLQTRVIDKIIFTRYRANSVQRPLHPIAATS
ncbi:hypothetical protein DPMN_118758 [Dreissena polymorpha]|uniref:Uncharacterized protein n=1 Tax=Dreissena polymorpha TaxID=45954 RepID=A0A9D4GKP9_DREPO|nr:hypothetical protein DPMN_118758 [Dreissena polymorpha]